MLTTPITQDAIREALRDVIDPEIGLNIVDLGLIYDITVNNGDVLITMTLTTPGCPLHDSIAEAAEEVIRFMVPGVQGVTVDLVWDPPWSPDLISEEGRHLLGWEA
jgi:metal-sulfur cluster biosynthetic enzyme